MLVRFLCFILLGLGVCVGTSCEDPDTAAVLGEDVEVVDAEAPAEDREDATPATINNLTDPVRPAADLVCPQGYVCFWNGGKYSGAKVAKGAEWLNQTQFFDHNKFSVKNHFTNKYVQVWGYSTGTRCLPPGMERSCWLNPGIEQFSVVDFCIDPTPDYCGN